MIQDKTFFTTKAVITKKVKVFLHQIHDTLQAEVDTASFHAPDGFKRHTHQFVKGEHLGDFPYLYLDYPKYFKHEEKFTFRTLFWWGHFFVFSWILEGAGLQFYKNRLLKHYSRLADKGLYILMKDSLWDWQKEPENLLEIRGDNREAVEKALETRSFLKLHCYLDFDHPTIREGTLNKAVLASFRLMLPIVLKQ